MKLMKLEQNLKGVIRHALAERSSVCIIPVSYHTKPGAATKLFSQHPWTVFFFHFFYSLAYNRLFFWELKLARRWRGKKPIFSLLPFKEPGRLLSLPGGSVRGNSDKRHGLETVT